MKMPDDMELKAEIDAISNRIDQILDTVQQHYPVCEPPPDASTVQPDTDYLSLTVIHNQKPEQEA